MFPTGDDGLVAATCRGDGAKAGQAIAEHLAAVGEQLAAGGQVLSGPDGASRREYS